MFLGLQDPDPLVRGTDPDPDLLVRGTDPDPDPSLFWIKTDYNVPAGKLWEKCGNKIFFASLKSLKKGVGPGSGYISQKCGSASISQRCGSWSISQRCGCGCGSGSASKCHGSPTLQIRHVLNLSLILFGPRWRCGWAWVGRTWGCSSAQQTPSSRPSLSSRYTKPFILKLKVSENLHNYAPGLRNPSY